MTSLPRQPYYWRLSRYEPELRARDTPWESWIDVSDIGESFNGIVLTEEEYLRVENTYIAALLRFALDVSATTFNMVHLGEDQEGGFALDADQVVVRSDLAPIIRGNLRGQIGCALKSTDGRLQIGFGYDLYVYVAASSACEQAVAEAIRDGLWIDTDVPPVWWENDEDPGD
jgi:hypothetical protein